MPPTGRPITADDDELRNKTPFQLAQFAAAKAANASQSAQESQSALLENNQAMLLLAADVSEAKANSRDAKFIALAIAEHFQVDLKELVMAGPPPHRGGKIIPIGSPRPFKAAIPRSDEDGDWEEETAEVTKNGRHVVVEISKFNHLTMTEGEYKKMKKKELDDFALLQQQSENQKTLARIAWWKSKLINVACTIGGGITLYIIKEIILKAAH